MNIKAVFCDVDGTLLNDQQEILSSTKLAIQNLQKNNIKFVLVSGRCPAGIYSVTQDSLDKCTVISHNGAIILDENKKILYEKGITHQKASEIIKFIEENNFDVAWNLYSFDDWITPNRNDPKIQHEEEMLKTLSKEGQIDSLPKDQIFHSIMLICNPDEIAEIRDKIALKFPDFTVVRSANELIDIMVEGVNKATAVSHLCDLLDIDIKDTMAFGDNYNDCEMLQAVGRGIVMGNAPDDMKKRFAEVTLDNNHDGISFALKKFKVIE